MLTARNSVEDRVTGLECGADDYLGKPLSFSELIACVRSLLRRSSYHFNECLSLDTLEVNVQKRTLTRSKSHRFDYKRV